MQTLLCVILGVSIQQQVNCNNAGRAILARSVDTKTKWRNVDQKTNSSKATMEIVFQALRLFHTINTVRNGSN